MSSSAFEKSARGAAGVHLVVAQLSLRGYVALPTTRNLKSVDVVAFNEGLSRFVFIQVKSTDKPKGGWPVYTIRKEDGWEQDVRQAVSLSDRFFHIFVSLSNSSEVEPTYYVVPSADVAQMIIDRNSRWVAAKLGRKATQPCAWEYGGPRPEIIAKYKDKWELLNLEG